MIYNYILLFLFYSIFGWSMEVVISFIYKHKFVNRGFLIGPYCPIYGVGGILITLLLSRYMDDVLVFFVMTVAIATVLEYITSYAMEKLFHARWWDYSQKKFNINGRVSLETCIGFGFVGIAIIYFGNPIVMKAISMLPNILVKIIAIVGMFIFLTDVIISLEVMSNLKRVKYVKRDNTEEITKQVKKALNEKNIFTKRLVEAFPDFKLLKERTKEKINKTKEEIRKKQKEIKIMKRELKKHEKKLNKLNKRGNK